MPQCSPTTRSRSKLNQADQLADNVGKNRARHGSANRNPGIAPVRRTLAGDGQHGMVILAEQDFMGFLVHHEGHAGLEIEGILRTMQAGDLAKGEFVEPTLIAADSNSARISQEEIFGPVATVIKFKTEEEVIAMANDSEYGLGGAVWTLNINRALRVAKAVETGRMWVNCYNRLPAGAPFGGYKTSGIGRENHKMMLAAYTQVKNIYISTREEREGMY